MYRIFTQWRTKWTTLVMLTLISLLIVWTNTIGLRHFTVPMTPDEQEYMGMAHQIGEFDTIPFHEARGFRIVFAMILSLFFKLVPYVNDVITIRILHAFLLVGIVIGFYRLGREKSKIFGILMAIFIALFSIPSFSLSFVGFYPSLIIYSLTPFFFRALLRKNYSTALIELGIMLAFHPMIAASVMLSGILFETMRRKFFKSLMMIVLGLILAAILHPILIDKWGELAFLKNAWVGGSIESFWRWWIPLALFGVFGAIVVLTNEREKNNGYLLIVIASSMLTVFNIFLFGLGASYGFMRALILPAFGALMMGAMGCTLLLEKNKGPYRLLSGVLTFIIIAFFLKNVVLINTQEYFFNPPNTLEEIKAYKWLEENTNEGNIILLSDFETMVAAHYYLPILNSVEIENIIFEQANFTNASPEVDSLTRVKPYHDFLVASAFSVETLQWLREKQNQYNPEGAYVFFGQRSFLNLYMYGFDPGKAHTMVVPSYSAKLPKNYLEKFLDDPRFQEVYFMDGIWIFKINL